MTDLVFVTCELYIFRTRFEAVEALVYLVTFRSRNAIKRECLFRVKELLGQYHSFNLPTLVQFMREKLPEGCEQEVS